MSDGLLAEPRLAALGLPQLHLNGFIKLFGFNHLVTTRIRDRLTHTYVEWSCFERYVYLVGEGVAAEVRGKDR